MGKLFGLLFAAAIWIVYVALNLLVVIGTIGILCWGVQFLLSLI